MIRRTLNTPQATPQLPWGGEVDALTKLKKANLHVHFFLLYSPGLARTKQERLENIDRTRHTRLYPKMHKRLLYGNTVMVNDDGCAPRTLCGFQRLGHARHKRRSVLAPYLHYRTKTHTRG